MRLPELSRQARRAAFLLGLAGAAALSGQAHAQGQTRTSIHPYLEVQQVVDADFSGGGDVLTYTSVGAGIDASVSSRKVHATVSYNYEHYFGWNKNSGDSDSHQGLAAARLEVVPNAVALDAGAIATRTHGDIRSAGPALRSAGNGASADVYAVYGGPSVSTHVGQIAVNADYHLGYVKVDDDDIVRTTPSGRPRIDRYSSSTVQQADVSLGMSPGELPIGWTVAGGWAHEDMDRFKSRYDEKYGRVDIVAPLSGHFAVTGGIGYEDIGASQQDILRDSAGLPVVTNGHVVADPTRPRIKTYDQNGAIWDVGFDWRPSPRTEVQGRYGRRYGGNTYTGSIRHQLNGDYSVSAFVFDNVSSFGRLMVSDLNGLPRNFNIRRNPFFTGLGPGGCVFGSQAGTGTCFDDALQSVANFNFRNRGVTALLSGGRGPWSFDLGASYVNRRYISPRTTGFALAGVTDESFTLDAVASRQLGNSSGLDIEGFAGWYDSGLAGEGSDFTSGVTLSYYRSLMGDHLQGNIAASLYNTNAGNSDSTVASILLGLRYTF